MRLNRGTFYSLPFPNSSTDEKLQKTIPPVELPTWALKCAQQAFLEACRYQRVQIQRPAQHWGLEVAHLHVLGSLMHSASLCTAQYSQQQGCTIPSPAVEGSKSPKGAGCQCPSMAQQSISHFSKSPGASLEYVSQLLFGATTLKPSSKDQKDLTYMFICGPLSKTTKVSLAWLNSMELCQCDPAKDLYVWLYFRDVKQVHQKHLEQELLDCILHTLGTGESPIKNSRR